MSTEPQFEPDQKEDADQSNEMSESRRAAEALESQIASLRQKLSEVMRSQSECQVSRAKTESALNLLRLQNNQLVANVTALRKQRDVFMEREADALVDGELLKTRVSEIEAQAKAIQEELNKQIEKLTISWKQADSALVELRDKFGHAKHAQKRAEAATRTTLNEKNELDEAFAWYLEGSRGLKSLHAQFKTKTHQELSVTCILGAYRVWVENGQPAFSKASEFADYIIACFAPAISH